MRKALPVTLILSALCLPAYANEGRVPQVRVEAPIPAVPDAGLVLTSSGTAAIAARETAGPDTFVLYGGPDHPTEGKFQLANGVTADWGSGNGLPGGYGGGPGAWTPVDMTMEPIYWHQSTFNAENLNSNGAGNHALWSGIAPGDPLGENYASLPGYGNNWFDVAMYWSEPLADPSVGQVVSLDFFFNYDVWDATWDFFRVQYDLDGVWMTVLEVTGFSRDENDIFQPPGVLFSAVQQAPIVYSGNDYGGPDGDRIRIRLLVTSDGGWSDQDIGGGLAGAAQVDDITLTTSQGVFTEDYEGPGPYLFNPFQLDFVGDFADLYARLSDLDPCRENNTPLAGFIDYGQILRNGPDESGATTTSGSTSAGVEYGITGNYVTNYTGGLTMGADALHNEIWSPDIAWDLPGVEDDDPTIAGAFIRFDVWSHLPLFNGIFYTWAVRGARIGEVYDGWDDRGFIYYEGGIPVWKDRREEVSDLLLSGPERVQMALGAIDYADLYGFPGSASTPSPCFDNAAFYKYRLQGPMLATRAVDTAQDGFPIVDSIDVITQAARDALDIPFSMARDVNLGDVVNAPGDSIIVHSVAVIPGTRNDDVRMVWTLNRNPLFEDAIRQPPATTWDENVVAGPGDWSGEVVGWMPSFDFNDRVFAMTLPDVDFMYPGDVLHYYFQSTDTDGNISTLPHDLTGFGVFGPDAIYHRAFTVRGLPSIDDAAGTQPEILVVNDFGRRGNEDEFTTAFRQLGLREGIDYDTYTVQGPTSTVSNGIGSAGAHGATAAQLAGYEHIFYLAGDLDSGLLSNGSNIGRNDKSNDIEVLEQWHALSGTRNCAYFGDNIAMGLTNDSSEGMAYLNTPMGVRYGDEDVRDMIGGQSAPLVVPDAAGAYASDFATEYIAYGGCLTINQFDQVQPGPGASAGHLFTDLAGVPIPPHPNPAQGGVASVINPRANGIDITFPYSIMYMHTIAAREVDLSARTQLFGEILGLFNAGSGGAPVAAPEMMRVELSVAPNPFNPLTTVQFTARLGSKGSVRVFNLRGQLVSTLHSGEFVQQEFRWDGTDSRGAAVGSGVYLIQATDGKATYTRKAALVK